MELDVSNFQKVKEKKDLQRLHSRAKKKMVVLQLSLAEQRFFTGKGQYGMLSLDGQMLRVAQWPNVGYNQIDKIIDSGPQTRYLPPNQKPPPYSAEKPSGRKFTTLEPLSPLLAREFQRTGDIRVQGYLHDDWYFQNEAIGKIDGDIIQLLKHTRYGIDNQIDSIPRRIRLVNVLAELDEPGEWYFEQQSKRLFLFPLKRFRKSKSRLFLVGGRLPEDPLVYLENTQYVTIRDLTIEYTGGIAVKIRGGHHNLIAGSKIRNGVKDGVSIENGHHNGITGCDFTELERAFSIRGGNIKKLERCYNFATDNEIYKCRRCGYGMISMTGVGLYFGHNLLHDMNGALSYRTVDSLIEFNEFYNIGFEMGDFNVAYTGAVWYTMDNVLRYNFVHHLIEPGGHPLAAFRNDDVGMGMKVFSNVFYRPGRAAIQFAGPLNEFVNNITIDARHVWWTNLRPTSKDDVAAEWASLSRFGRDLPKGDKGDNVYILEKLLGKKGWEKKPWSVEYPELKRAIDLNPFAQTFSQVSHNYAALIREDFHIHGGDGTIESMESKSVGTASGLPSSGLFELPENITPEAFEKPLDLNFALKKNFKAIDGFQTIPFHEIGLVKDEFRKSSPSKLRYRRAVMRKYQHDRGGKYIRDKVNSRYPPNAT